MSRGKGLRVRWWGRFRAVLMLPVFVLLFLVYIPAGDVITTASRDAVILLTEARNAKKALRRAGSIVLVFLGAVGAFVLWLFVLTILGDVVQPWGALLWPLWFVAGFLCLAPSTGGSFSASIEALTLRPKGPYWVAQGLASAPGAQWRGLDFAKAAIEAFVPRCAPVVATAASQKLAVIYERFGFVRNKPGSLNVTFWPSGAAVHG